MNFKDKFKCNVRKVMHNFAAQCGCSLSESELDELEGYPTPDKIAKIYEGIKNPAIGGRFFVALLKKIGAKLAVQAQNN